MSKAEKILDRMRVTSAGWGQKDFEHLFDGYGFEKRQGNRHTIYFHPKYPELWISIPRHNNMKNCYPRDAVKLIDELIVKQNKEKEDEQS
jgi:hypothetical protein